jgi:hypothetical protein
LLAERRARPDSPGRSTGFAAVLWADRAADVVAGLLRFTDKGGFTLGNFVKLATDPTRDPLVTTGIIATSSAVICCLVAAPWLAGRAHRHAAAPHHPRW